MAWLSDGAGAPGAASLVSLAPNGISFSPGVYAGGGVRIMISRPVNGPSRRRAFELRRQESPLTGLKTRSESESLSLAPLPLEFCRPLLTVLLTCITTISRPGSVGNLLTRSASRASEAESSCKLALTRLRFGLMFQPSFPPPPFTIPDHAVPGAVAP